MIEQIERNGYVFQIDRKRPTLRFKGGKGGSKLPAQKVVQKVDQSANDQSRLARAAAYRRYSKARQVTRLNEMWKPENRKTLGAR